MNLNGTSAEAASMMPTQGSVAESGDREDAGDVGEGRRRRRRGGRGRGRDVAEGADVTVNAQNAEPSAMGDNVEPLSAAEGQTPSLWQLASAPQVSASATNSASADEEPALVTTAALGTAADGAAQANEVAGQPATQAPAATADAPSARAAEPFVLPIEALQALAAQAGLQWVHSDAQKVRAVQEVIASTPKPVHVPRMPKPQVMVDEGPLVLVETRKDLSRLRMPFDQP
jgi:ribonuclease E